MSPAYLDIADNDEDRRIEIIGHTVMHHKKTAAFIVDDEPGKADRYIKKPVVGQFEMRPNWPTQLFRRKHESVLRFRGVPKHGR